LNEDNIGFFDIRTTYGGRKFGMRLRKELVFFLLLSAVKLPAQVPRIVSYQGYLTDATGKPVADGGRKMTFKIYPTEIGGSALWEETQYSVDVQGGAFSVTLGSFNALNLVFDRSYWLGISTDNGSELTPRLRLSASPYSIRSIYSDVAGAVYDNSIGNNQLKRNAVGLGNLSTDVVRNLLATGDNIAIEPDTVNRKIRISVVGGGVSQNHIIGIWNTSTGTNALVSNTTGTGNTATGAAALQTNTIGNYNAAEGYFALKNNVASFNTASGASALENNTTAAYNTAIGFNALNKNLDGQDNTAAGAYALYSNLTGDENSAFGRSALYYNLGNHNSAFGGYALMSNTTGDYNSAFGHGALIHNTIGVENTGVGISALWANTTASYNTGLGGGALELTTTGGDNFSGGFRNLHDNTEGTRNASAGYYGMFYNRTGNYNTSLGAYSGAGRNIGETNFSSTIAIGAYTFPTASNQGVIGGSDPSGYGKITDLYLGNGVASAAPGSIALHASGATGANEAGGNITIAGGKATGNAVGGSIVFATSDATGAGFVQQSLTDKVKINSFGGIELRNLEADPASGQGLFVRARNSSNADTLVFRYANGTMKRWISN
jgi:trimeric autotransporter adhesin